ncbi:MAG: alpha/beta fold hydrolase [Burkholderiaceae bacterium]|nr:MAG: alpha/beta fold hydrolase [Burkholderiaceae bacterium]
MDRQDDFERGVANRRAVLGDEWVDQSLGGTTQFNADFQDLVTRHAWLDIWGRPGLDVVTRRLLVLGMTMAAARTVALQCSSNSSQRAGVPLEKIRETLMQGAIYCGVPAANTAFKLTTKILREEGKLPPAAPLTTGVRAAVHHTFSAPQLRVAIQGQGTPVVLSHALGADLHLWDGLAATLAPRHEVLRYDHRGHGGSAVPTGPYSQDELVDDAARLIREWGRGPVVFVGLSMGGMVAQGLAVRHPELLRGVVIAHSSARYPDEVRAMWAQRIAAIEQGGLAAIADATMERWFTPAFRAAQPAVVEQVRQTVLRSSAAGYIACGRAVASVDWLDRLSAVKTPSLVIAGAQDAGAPPAMSEAIASRIAGAELRVIEAAHIGVLEQPQAFAEAVGGFIAARCGG